MQSLTFEVTFNGQKSTFSEVDRSYTPKHRHPAKEMESERGIPEWYKPPDSRWVRKIYKRGQNKESKGRDCQPEIMKKSQAKNVIRNVEAQSHQVSTKKSQRS